MADRSRWLVSTEWLAAHLADSNLVILDGSWHLPASGRHGSAEYETAHIPGALFFDIDAVADTGDPLPHMLPTPEHFAAMVGAMGIGDGDRIVVYDSLGLFSAPRVWWTFKVMGARDVVILDGGLPKWQAEGRPVESGPARQRPAPRLTFLPQRPAGEASCPRSFHPGNRSRRTSAGCKESIEWHRPE